ncbi:MAG: DUF547 domain-containing protein [Burkholderiales bacterium]|nr:DUF547 domain-containing protein [Burkholderiales bacterium]
MVLEGAHASRLDYAGIARERAALREYLEALSRVTEAEFRAFSKAQQIAFLVNAYNAFAVEKVLARYPDIRSIRDFGRLFGNPFRDRFFRLLGRPMSLDAIEHEMLRRPGAYDEPRVHYALNCAAVGCPMLREEAYVAERLEAQLEEQAVRFLSDRTRNRVSADGRLEVSRIFEWYGEDWKRGAQGADSLERYFARYAHLLADDPALQKRVAEGRAPISFLPYDWSLNDVRR